MSTGRLRPTEAIEPASVVGSAIAETLGARAHIDVMIPRTDVAGKLRLVDRAEALEIKAAVRALFKRKDLLDGEGNVIPLAVDDWNAEIAVRHLSVAIRNPDDVTKPLDTIDEWRMCDDEQIGALWHRYQDYRDLTDPLGDHDIALSDADVSMMREAVKKKEPSVLMSFGSRKLAIFLLTSAAPPAP